MASTISPILILLSLTPCLFLIFAPQIQAQSAPAPEPPGPINLTRILEIGGQYTTFIRLLNTTQVSNQITNQLNSSTEGMTVFAPTDNAFNNLKPGTLNGLSVQQQVQLVLYHVLPKYYSLVMFQTVSNPVRTQATGQDGGVFGLNFTSTGTNQVNISTGVVVTQLNNALRQDFPLAVYQVDMVLLPFELFGPKPPPSATPPSAGPSGSDNKSPGSSSGDASNKNNSGSKERQIGLGLVAGIGLVCMGVLF
ncbi:FAS1 domain [Macleaya cordata]|uniref:FAS1 domain n=1 Tax=Macleaya cordata TaxID=56857 RepID=A0A200QL24_MACCD|nr:FAS1 domain [Macleaya cordata]